MAADEWEGTDVAVKFRFVIVRETIGFQRPDLFGGPNSRLWNSSETLESLWEVQSLV